MPRQHDQPYEKSVTINCLPEPLRGKKVGRPATSFTPQKIEALLIALCKGHARKHALALSCLNQKTFEHWMHQGKFDYENTPEGMDYSPHACFYEDVIHAEAIGVDNLIDRMWKAAEADARSWQAVMTLYERLHREDFAQTTNVNQTIEGRNTLNVVVRVVGGDEWLTGKPQQAIEAAAETLVEDTEIIAGEFA